MCAWLILASQESLAEATLMPMGKGFAITTHVDLAEQLRQGYEVVADVSLPRIKITAILNDAVATLVSFAYRHRENQSQHAVMGLIVGTGANATTFLPLSKLGAAKWPRDVRDPDIRIAVNTEWSINGTASALRNLALITKWDAALDAAGELAGFQPLEYMTAGRYLGELGRLILVDYLTNELRIPVQQLPPKLQQRHGLTTAFLGNLGPHLQHTTGRSMLQQLQHELLPPAAPLLPATTASPSSIPAFTWTEETANLTYTLARAIQRRASALTAAATLALALFADMHKLPCLRADSALLIGYTGGCIQHFQQYLVDCQTFLDTLAPRLFVSGAQRQEQQEQQQQSRLPTLRLVPCHDGGIVGAGILASVVQREVD